MISNCTWMMYMRCTWDVFSVFFLQTERDSLKLQCQTLQAELEKNNETQVRIYMYNDMVCNVSYFVVCVRNTWILNCAKLCLMDLLLTVQKCCQWTRGDSWEGKDMLIQWASKIVTVKTGHWISSNFKFGVKSYKLVL